MQNAMENLLTRRSVRKYRADRVPKAQIEQIMRAGLLAANGRNRQGVIVVAVTNQEIRGRLSEVNRQIGGREAGFDPFYGAPEVLIVLSDRASSTYLYDGSCVMENLMLAAHALGIGSCWIHRAKQTFDMPEWKEWLRTLGIEGDYEGIGQCVLGYAEGEEPQAPAEKQNRIFFAE